MTCNSTSTLSREKRTDKLDTGSFGMCRAQRGAYCKRFLGPFHAWNLGAAEMSHLKTPEQVNEPTSGDCLGVGIRCAPLKTDTPRNIVSVVVSRFRETSARMASTGPQSTGSFRNRAKPKEQSNSREKKSLLWDRHQWEATRASVKTLEQIVIGFKPVNRLAVTQAGLWKSRSFVILTSTTQFAVADVAMDNARSRHRLSA